MERTAHKYEFMYGARFKWLLNICPETEQYRAVCSLHNLK